jgi:acyl carrier protein
MPPVNATITQILEEKLGLNKKELKDDARFYQDLGVDSLDFIEVISEVERTYKIEIPDDDLGKLSNVGSFVNYIAEKVKKKRVPQMA